MVPLSNNAAVAAILNPVDSWGKRAAARQEAYQIQSILTQEAQQQLTQEQQAAAQTEQYLQTVKSLPFVGRDVQKLSAYVRDNMEKEVFTRLRDVYGGNFKRWYQAEGSAWMQQSAARLQQSPFYQQAMENRLNVDQARKAMQDGQFLVGQVGKSGYTQGERIFQDFVSGKSDAYRFNGAYKPEDDLKGLRDVYAPGKMPWEITPVSEEAKLNHLIDQHGREKGLDKYYRQHQGTQVLYKYDPLTKKFDFMRDEGRYRMEQGRYGMARSEHGMNMKLKGQQLQLNNLKIAEKVQELTGTDAAGMNYDQKLFGAANEQMRLRLDNDGSKVLPSGIDLTKIPALSSVSLYGKQSQVIEQALGLSRRKDGFNRGSIKEGFTEMGGVTPLDLSGANFSVVNVDPKLYFNAGDIGPNGQRNPNGVQGFARVTLQFSNADEAIKLGLYDGYFTSKKGAGVYNPDTKTATILTPIGAVDQMRNPAFVNALVKSQMGTKRANEEWDDTPSILEPTF